MGFFDKLKKINIFSSFGSELTDDFYDELEESLILADTGMDTTLELVEELRRRVKDEHIKTVEEARSCMCRCIADALNAGDVSLNLSTRPSVVLFIIGKIGYQLRRERKKVLFCAADTFRAAAADQLTIWADRAGVEIVKQHEGADPAAVVFDAATAAKARNTDVMLVDTAGRLHNKQGRPCWCWTPPRGRMASSRPSSLKRPPASPASSSPSWTAPPRGGSPLPSPGSWAYPSSTPVWARAWTT